MDEEPGFGTACPEEPLFCDKIVTDAHLNITKKSLAYDVVIQEKETGRRFEFRLYYVPEVSDSMLGWSNRCAALTDRPTAIIEGKEIDNERRHYCGR